MNTRKRRSGFLMVQMLIVLALLAAFGILAERVVRLSLHTLNKAEVEQDELIRRERAMHALRADVWSASRVEVTDKSHVRISGEAESIEWSTLANGDVRRTEKSEEQKWVGLSLEFEQQDGWLVVKHRGKEIGLLQQAKAMGAK
jgi:hypothetical protein